MSSISAAWRNLPPAIRAGITTGWQAFAGSALLTLIGLLDAIREWVDAGGDPPDFSQFARLVGSAFVGLTAAVITATFRFVKPPAIAYPDAELTGNDRVN